MKHQSQGAFVSQIDYIFLTLLGSAALVAVGSFASIANYLFAHELADRNNPMPNIIDLYKKYRDHTRAASGRVAPLLWVHITAVGAFIIAGMVYVILKFV
jgi:hypothetical protein